MKVQLAHIVQSLFQTADLDDVPQHKLEEMVKDHPYFSAGQFLLAQKMKHQDPEQYKEQVQKTALHFHDPLWLYWQLELQEKEAVLPELKRDTKPEEPAASVVGVVERVEESEIAVVSDPVPHEEVAHEEIAPEDISADTTETFHIDESVLSGDSALDRTAGVDTSEIEDEVEVVEIPEEVHSIAVQEDEVETVQESDNESAATQPTDQSQSNINATSPNLRSQPEKPEAPLAFDPYYTIDYFASQGIKAPAELQPTDKLGKQLKSFTEWLKTMKRLPQPQAEAQADETEQQHIRQFADGSLEKKEVVTETMAEVLVKQDKKDEAIAIYEKLSLLDPSKRAYFAAKIENLKVN